MWGGARNRRPGDARLCLGAPALLSAADNGEHNRRSSPFRTRSRHDRYPVRQRAVRTLSRLCAVDDRSEEHTSELQSLMRISYAVFCLKKKTYHNNQHHTIHRKSSETTNEV